MVTGNVYIRRNTLHETLGFLNIPSYLCTQEKEYVYDKNNEYA